MSQTQVDLIFDGSIVTADISDSAVTNAKLANLSVSTQKIIDKSVTPAKLSDDVVYSTFNAPFTTKGFSIPF